MNKNSSRFPSNAIILGMASLMMLILTSSLAFGWEQICSGEQIKATLSGHEIKGIWEGKKYTQTYHKDGSTIYKQENESSFSGKWYVKENKYCSNFGYGERCYQIGREGNRFYWLFPSGERREFTIVK
jgi:hypothetical protein